MMTCLIKWKWLADRKARREAIMVLRWQMEEAINRVIR